MKKLLICILSVFTATIVWAASPVFEGFTLIASNASVDYHFYGKNQSGEFVETKGGKTVYVISTMRVFNGKIMHGKAYVTGDDCGAKQGKIVYLSLDGSVSERADFVSEGPSINDAVGRTICGADAGDIKAIKERQQKDNNDSII